MSVEERESIGCYIFDHFLSEQAFETAQKLVV